MVNGLGNVYVPIGSTSDQAKKIGRGASGDSCSQAFKNLANCGQASVCSLRGKTKKRCSWRNIGKVALISLIASYAISSTTGCVINGTEEIPILQSFKTWDAFPYSDQGRLIVSTLSAPLQEVRLIQSPMKIGNSLKIAGSQSCATKDNAFFISSYADKIVRIIDTTDSSNLYVANILNAGTSISDMLRIDDRLYMTGPGIPLKIFDIDNQDPLKVTPFSQIMNSSINAYKIASMGTSSFGCIAANGFFCLDASDPENPFVAGSIPSLIGTAIASSGSGYYYVGTSSGLAIVNATNPSMPIQCGFTSISRIYDIYYENGLCSLGTLNGVLTVDVRNPCAVTVVHSLPISSGVRSFLPAGDLMYFSTLLTYGIGILDTRNASNPIVSVLDLFPEMGGGVFMGALLGDQIVIRGNNDVFFATRQDAFAFSGTPKAGTKGSHEVTLTAKTLLGGVTINDTRSCRFNINPVITSSSPLSNIIGAVGQVINAVISPNAFVHALNLPITYHLNCTSDKSTLPSAVTLNPVDGQFSSRTLVEGDVGTSNCVVEATDSYDASGMSPSFNMMVFYGPKINPISNQIAISGQPFFVPVNATSRDAISEITFAVSGLPSSFSYHNGNITGTASDSDLGSYPIEVTATDQNGIANTQAFTLTIAQPGYPVITRSLESYTVTIGTPFVIVFPQGIATNPTNPNAKFTYSVRLANGSPLPDWATFDDAELKLSGKPSDESAPIFETSYPCVLIVTEELSNGEQRSANTIFNLTVTGNSIFRKMLFAAPFVTGVLGFVAGARVSLYNSAVNSPRFTSCVNKVLCCRKRDIRLHHERIELFEGQSFKYVFRNSKGEIVGFKTSYDGKSPTGSSLPSWMKSSYDEGIARWNLNAMYVPNSDSIRTITITAVDSKGYDLEKVTFTRVSAARNSSFERQCFKHVEPLEARFFYTKDPRRPVDPPSWLIYDREHSIIRATNAPPRSEMEPMRIELVDSRNRKLDIIYLNQPSDEMLLAITDNSSDSKEGALTISTSASTSTSASSLLSSVTPSSGSVTSSSNGIDIELTESKNPMSQQPLIEGSTGSQELT